MRKSQEQPTTRKGGTKLGGSMFTVALATAVLGVMVAPVTAVRAQAGALSGTQTSPSMWEYVYIVSEGADVVSVLDAATNAEVATVSVGLQPTSIAIAPDGAVAYVTNSGPASVSVIDTATNTVIGTIGIPVPTEHEPWEVNYGVAPETILLSPDGAVAYVAGTSLSSGGPHDYRWRGVITTIDLVSQTPVSTAIVGNGCGNEIAVAPDGGTLYTVQESVCSPYDSSTDRHTIVSALVPSTYAVTRSAALAGTHPRVLRLSPEGTRLYVVNYDAEGTVLTVLDALTLSVLARLQVNDASDIAFTPDGRRAYLQTDTGLEVLDPVTLVRSTTIQAGDATSTVAVSSDGQRLYVANAASYTLSVIDGTTNTLTATIPVRAKPRAVALAVLDHAVAIPTPRPTPGATQMCAYTAIYTGDVAIVNTETKRVTGHIPVTGREIVIDRDNEFAYVPRSEWSDIAVIDLSAQAVVAEIPLPGWPMEIAVSADRRLAYVAIYQEGIAVIDLAARDVITVVPTGGYVYSIAPAAKHVYAMTRPCVLEECRTVVLVIDAETQQVVSTMDLGSVFHEQLAVSPDETRLFAPIFSNGLWALGVIDSMNGDVVRTVPLDSNVWNLAVHPDGRTVYVLNERVKVIDTVDGVVVANLGVTAENMAFTPDGLFGYLSGWWADGSGEIFVIDTRTNAVVDDLGTDGTPLGIAIGLVPDGCVDSSALTPRPTRTVTPTPSSTATPTPTRTLRPTRTPLPTHTPTVAVQIAIDSIAGNAGAVVSIAARLHSNGYAVVGVQHDLSFDGKVAVAARANGRPDCSVSPAIAKPGTIFGFLPAGCTPGVSCTGLRVVVVSVDSVDVIPDGAILYTCAVAISRDAAPGVYLLHLSRVIAANPSGRVVPATAKDGMITVTGGSALERCPGDCDSSGEVSIDELITTVNIASSVMPVDTCAVADADGSGAVTVDEVLLAVQMTLYGCS